MTNFLLIGAFLSAIAVTAACGKKPEEESRADLNQGKPYHETCIKGVLYVRPTFNYVGSSFTPVYNLQGQLTPCTEESR